MAFQPLTSRGRWPQADRTGATADGPPPVAAMPAVLAANPRISQNIPFCLRGGRPGPVRRGAGQIENHRQP